MWKKGERMKDRNKRFTCHFYNKELDWCKGKDNYCDGWCTA